MTTAKSALGSAISTWLSSLPAGQECARPRARRQPRDPQERIKVPAATGTGVLTPRELDVLRTLAGDCTYAQAAARLGISTHTVVTHLKNAYRKLDVHSAAAAVMRVMEQGLFKALDASQETGQKSPVRRWHSI